MAAAIVGAIAFAGGYAVGQRGPIAVVDVQQPGYNATGCTVPQTCFVNITLSNSTLGFGESGNAPCTKDAVGRPRCVFVGDNETWVCTRNATAAERCDHFGGSP